MRLPGALPLAFAPEFETQSYDTSGVVHEFVVPVGVYTLHVDARGGGSGAAGANPAGLGARVQTDLTVTPGETLYIRVGAASNTVNLSTNSGSSGGYPDGANGGNGNAGTGGSGGGGATEIRQAADTASDRVVVAGGCGGQSAGGNSNPPLSVTTLDDEGVTASAATVGSNATILFNSGGGGGGGGWRGGTGGGQNNKGLGGTNMCHSTKTANTVVTANYETGHGQIELTWVPGTVSSTALIVNDGSHGHNVDNVELVINYELSPDGGVHSHSGDNVELTQVYQLAVADAVHGHLSDSPTLEQAHALAADESSHGHSADGPTLTQTHVLDVDGALHTHTADGVALSQDHALSINDAVHGHTADLVAITTDSNLGVNSAIHGHVADSPSLTQAHELSTAEATHGHSADNVTITPAVLDPTNLQVSQVGNDVEITWDSELLAGVTNVDIFRRLGTDTSPFVPGVNARLVRIPAGVGSYTDTSVSDGDYVYQAFSVRVEP